MNEIMISLNGDRAYVQFSLLEEKEESLSVVKKKRKKRTEDKSGVICREMKVSLAFFKIGVGMLKNNSAKTHRWNGK